ncbi:MAG: hypothetical protein ACYC27_21455 [Armatimonadota bacterium]
MLKLKLILASVLLTFIPLWITAGDLILCMVRFDAYQSIEKAFPGVIQKSMIIPAILIWVGYIWIKYRIKTVIRWQFWVGVLILSFGVMRILPIIHNEMGIFIQYYLYSYISWTGLIVHIIGLIVLTAKLTIWRFWWLNIGVKTYKYLNKQEV